MSEPAIYRIRVRGHIDPDQSPRLESMNITQTDGLRGDVVSVLVGRLTDQGALTGVLNSLYESHRPVLSVECLESE